MVYTNYVSLRWNSFPFNFKIWSSEVNENEDGVAGTQSDAASPINAIANDKIAAMTSVVQKKSQVRKIKKYLYWCWLAAVIYAVSSNDSYKSKGI